jgi:hypothetical protein
MDILTSLQTIDDKLFDWILDTTPVTDDDRNQMKAVAAVRTQIESQIDMLVLQKVDLSIPALAAYESQLADIAANIRSMAADIAKVKTVIGYASTAVGVGAQVAGAIAAL